MPTRRPDLKKALGREAVFGDAAAPSTSSPQRPRAKKDDEPTPKREERISRVTYHVPIDLQEAVKVEATQSGRTQSGVVSDLLRAHLPSAGARKAGRAS